MRSIKSCIDVGAEAEVGDGDGDGDRVGDEADTVTEAEAEAKAEAEAEAEVDIVKLLMDTCKFDIIIENFLSRIKNSLFNCFFSDIYVTSFSNISYCINCE